MVEEAQTKTIGKYEILGTLGRGSMGVVYRGRDPEIGREVAIKTLRRITSTQFNDAELALERFKVEARSAGNLRHPNIITIFDVNVDDDTPYIVMDYVQGESLDQVLSREGRFDPGRTLRYLEQIGAGLDAAHKANVIHRDIKPSNLIADSNETIYILDFGVARINESFSESEKVVRPEPVMGTPGYMSPEQILNEELDARSDLFSLAIVAFEFLTGKRPFEGANFTEIVGNILNKKEISLTSLAPELPLALEEQFERAFSKNRTKRFSSADEMVKAFKRASGLSSGTLPVSRDEAGQQRVRKPSEWKSIPISGQSEAGVPPKSGSEDLYSGLSKTPPVSEGGEKQSRAWESTGTQEMRLKGMSDLSAARSPEKRESSPGELFRGADTLARAPMTKRRPPLARVLTALFGGVLVVLSAYLFISVYGGAGSSTSSLVPALAPKGPVEPVQSNSNVPSLSDDSVTQAELVEIPEGKTVNELNDKELVSLLVSGEGSDTEVLAALSEARNRRIPNLVEAAVYPLDSDSYVVRIETLKLLSELGDKRVVPRLVDILNDHDPLVRAYAADAIGKLGSRASLSYLSSRFRLEQNARVKESLKKAIESIRGFPVVDD